MHTTEPEWDAHIAHITGRQQFVQPLISVIDVNIFEPVNIFIYVEGIKYKVLSIIKAIDICFKIFFAFNIKYPLASEAFWQFINQYFYNVGNTTSRKHTSVNVFLNEIKNL